MQSDNSHLDPQYYFIAKTYPLYNHIKWLKRLSGYFLFPNFLFLLQLLILFQRLADTSRFSSLEDGFLRFPFVLSRQLYHNSGFGACTNYYCIDYIFSCIINYVNVVKYRNTTISYPKVYFYSKQSVFCLFNI